MVTKALSPNFEEDIFINYDHDDNKSLVKDFRGWVDTMHESLTTRLTMLIGEKPKIWRDVEQLAGNQPLTETIVIKLSKTAFLVSVLSPSYVKSKWCRKELREFYRRADLTGGIKINNKSRIFKVVKTPIGDNEPGADPFKVVKTPIGANEPSADPLEEELPLELRTLLQESLGYEFFEIDERGKLREFWPEMGPDHLKKFLERLEDLAQDIKEFIKFQQAAPAERDCKKNNIYLAETTPELSGCRADIKRTLQLHNYHVLPEDNLPLLDDAAFDTKVSEYLQRSSLSIHLIGSDHTSIVAEDEKTMARLDIQHQLAADRVRRQHELAMVRADDDSTYSRLIWIPSTTTPRDDRYKEFIEYLQNDPGVNENGDVFTQSLENFKTQIQGKLKFSRDISRNEKVKRVYLICDKQDLSAAMPLQSSLQQQGYEVVLPFKNDGQVVIGHKENLRSSDAVLIFYGSTNTMEWKLKDLRRADVFRNDKPLLAKAIYVAGPETDQKRAFTTDEALVMKNFGEFTPESIQPFLAELGKTASMSAGGARE